MSKKKKPVDKGHDISLMVVALETIEGICLLDGRDGIKIRNDFYKWAHVALCRCDSMHDDWKESLLVLHKELKRRYII